MPGQPRRSTLVALLAFAALAACTDDAPGPVSPGDAGPRAYVEEDSVSPPEDGNLFPGEAEFEELAREIPGFAGYWYEGDTRVVALTDVGQGERAVSVIGAKVPAPEPGAREGAPGAGSTRIVPSDYDFVTLRDWRNRLLDPVLNVEAATFVDLDEENNRITIGIVEPGAQDAVAEQVAASDVPLEAVRFEVTGPVEAHQTLQGRVRPLLGGVQIAWDNSLCTLGFTTTNPANGANAFVTNSHCSRTEWGLDGVFYGQPNVHPTNIVGREVRDPRGFRCGLFSRCRFSDAALVEVGAGVPFALDQIAQTQWWVHGWNWGSINIVNPPLAVTAFRRWPATGQMVDKIGRTTGWNYGFVRNSCMAVNFRRRLLCQYSATYRSEGGDSGSPVFIWHGNTVELTGLNWGASGLLRRSYFSPLGGVRLDLGVPQ